MNYYGLIHNPSNSSMTEGIHGFDLVFGVTLFAGSVLWQAMSRFRAWYAVRVGTGEFSHRPVGGFGLLAGTRLCPVSKTLLTIENYHKAKGMRSILFLQSLIH